MAKLIKFGWSYFNKSWKDKAMKTKNILIWGCAITVFIIFIALIWRLKPDDSAAYTPVIAPSAQQLNNEQNIDLQEPIALPQKNNTVTVLTQADATKRLNQLQHDMQATLKCVMENPQNTCGLTVDPNDPKAAYREAVQSLQAALKEIAEIGSHHPQVAEQAQEIARDFVLFQDNQVQEAALDILQQYPPSKENFEVIKKTVLNSATSQQTMYSMQSLSRYNSPQELAEVTPVFIQVLQSGAFGAADQAAYEIYPFITPDNILLYESLLPQLDPDMERTRRLNDILQKWKAEHQGTSMNKNRG
jgi:hypothetical protein